MKLLILLLPYLDEDARQALDSLYGVVFSCLNIEALRYGKPRSSASGLQLTAFPSDRERACHLLYLITKRRHVKHFRLAKLCVLVLSNRRRD